MKIADLAGLKFGKLTAKERVGSDNRGNSIWRCVCECGNEKDVVGYKLKSGQIKSCGCLTAGGNRTTHNKSKTKLYDVWVSMKQRCYNSKSNSYSNYGARGISVCKSWSDSFMSFYSWAIENGYEDGLSIERIDNDKGYCPQNCQFSDYIRQSNNRRNNHILTFRGEQHTISEWASICGINAKTIVGRINSRNWSIEDALTKPVKHRKANSNSVVPSSIG